MRARTPPLFDELGPELPFAAGANAARDAQVAPPRAVRDSAARDARARAALGGHHRAALGREGQRVQGGDRGRGNPVVRARAAHDQGYPPGRPDHPLRQVRIREVARALQSREHRGERRGAERHADPGVAPECERHPAREHGRAPAEAHRPVRPRALQGAPEPQRRPALHQQAGARPRVGPVDAADDPPAQQSRRQLRRRRGRVGESELLHERLLQHRGDRQGRRDRRRLRHRRRARAPHRHAPRCAGRVLRIGRLSGRGTDRGRESRPDRRRHPYRVVPPSRRLSARRDGRPVAGGRTCRLQPHAQRLSADGELHHARDARVLRRGDGPDRQAARARARDDPARRIRPADRPREPLRGAARAAQRRVDAREPVAARPAVHRPRQFQDRQRHARRACPTRSATKARSRASAATSSSS